MKKNYVLLLIAALCVILSACTKEGVYNPKEKISRIFYQSSNSNGKNLQESWTWDKNLLSKIVDENGDFRNFEYDGKQLKTVRYSNGDKLEYTYDGGKVTKAEVFSSNELYSSFTFEHDGSKISKVTVTFYDNSGNAIRAFAGLDAIFTDPVMNESVKRDIVKNRATFGTKSSTETYTYNYEWDGDNVKKMDCEYNVSGQFFTSTCTYSYDKNPNPFYRSLSEGDELVNSKNNITKYVSEDSEGGYYESSYTYKYDGKFPIERTFYGDGGYYYTSYYEYEE